MGCSMGACSIWSCLKYIPHRHLIFISLWSILIYFSFINSELSFIYRLLGASPVVPFVNYWWPSVPSALSLQTFRSLPRSMNAWWVSLFLLVLSNFSISNVSFATKFRKKVTQQGEHELLNRDILASYGSKWEFNPIIDLSNSFPDNNGSIHI